jgi:hypothetical protein
VRQPPKPLHLVGPKSNIVGDIVRFSGIFLAPTALAVAIAPVVLVQAAHAQDIAPITETVVGSVRGGEGTLSAGTSDGIRVGAVYDIVRDGRVRAHARVVRTYSARSEVRFFDVEEEYVVTVGDVARFVRIDTTATSPAPVATPRPAPVVTPPVVTSPTPPSTVETLSPAPEAVAMKPRPLTTRATVLASVTAIEGTDVTINAGSNSGVTDGKNLPIMRDGNVIGIVRVQSVTSDSSVGTITWSDSAAGSIMAGDSVQVVRERSASDPINLNADIPAAPVPYETGASNYTVPKHDRTYDLLASLAADRLITSQPAHVFHDEGSRRHRTEEDLTFSRAQIAGFIREALESPRADADKTRNRVALGNLITNYRTDLERIGVSEEQLNAYAPDGGFEFGISGQTRASLVGGDDNGYLDAFSERNGSLRLRSGIDSRTNIFGRAGDRLQFFGTVDSGTDRRRGTDDRTFDVRRLVASYNASNLLRGLTIEAGRQEFWWGPGHFGTLMLGDNAGPLNSLRTIFKRGSYSVESLYSPLGTGPGGGSRSLYGKNFQVKLGQNARIGYSESVISPERSFDPVLFASTFSPVPLTIAQRAARENGGSDQSNVLSSAYFEAGIARGLTTYGELLVDDLGFSDRNRVRNRIGTLLGAHVFKPGDPGRLGMYAEYANLEGRTYLRFNTLGALTGDYEYYYRGFPLGYPVAPRPLPSGGPGATPGLGGASSLRTDVYWRATPKLRLGAGLELADLDSELPIISRQQIFRFRAAYEVARNFTVVARAQRISTSNPGFVAGPALRQKLLQLEVVRAF